MSEANTVAVEATVNGYKLTAHFSRKVSDGDYGSTEASVWVEGTIGPDASSEEINAEASRLFLPAKAAVLDELDITSALDDNGFLRETATPFRSVTQATQKVQAAIPGTTRQKGGDIKVYNNAQKTWEFAGDLPDWLFEDGKLKEWGVDRLFRTTSKDDRSVVLNYKEAGNNATHGKDGQPYVWWNPDRPSRQD